MTDTEKKHRIEQYIKEAIRKIENAKKDKKFDQGASANAERLIRALEAGNLTQNQIQCATQEKQNEEFILSAIEFFVGRGFKIND